MPLSHTSDNLENSAFPLGNSNNLGIPRQTFCVEQSGLRFILLRWHSSVLESSRLWWQRWGNLCSAFHPELSLTR